MINGVYPGYARLILYLKTNLYNPPNINYLKKKNYKIISIDGGKASDKLRYPSDKNCQHTRTRWKLPQLDKGRV